MNPYYQIRDLSKKFPAYEDVLSILLSNNIKIVSDEKLLQPPLIYFNVNKLHFVYKEPYSCKLYFFSENEEIRELLYITIRKGQPISFVYKK